MRRALLKKFALVLLAEIMLLRKQGRVRARGRSHT